jgi:pantetheine-phosphate adenylyltransferase
MFDINSRIEIIKQTFINESRVEVIAYKGLTVNLCDNLRVYTILRGLRNTSDFEFESAISHINKQLNNKIETIFMLISAQQASISSSIVRDIIINNGDVSQFMPNAININNYQRLY